VNKLETDCDYTLYTLEVHSGWANTPSSYWPLLC